MTDAPPDDKDPGRDGDKPRGQGPRRRFGGASGSRGSTSRGGDRGASRPPGSGKPGSGKPRSGKAGPARPGSAKPAARKGGSRPGGPRAAGARGTGKPPQPSGPAVPDEVTGGELDREVREELRTLSRDAAETVSRHLVMTARLLDEDPRLAWEHARAAVTRGGRLAVVREAAGVAAYRAGEYADALSQLRAARRISGSDAYWPMMADCERGLGRPDRALTMAGAPEVGHLDRAGRAEMRIVASGARRDLDQLDAALVTLQCAELRSNDRASWSARIKYAYADTLQAVGRTDEARQWFERAEQVDADGETEAAERLAELDGLVWTDLETDPS